MHASTMLLMENVQRTYRAIAMHRFIHPQFLCLHLFSMYVFATERSGVHMQIVQEVVDVRIEIGTTRTLQKS